MTRGHLGAARRPSANLSVSISVSTYVSVHVSDCRVTCCELSSGGVYVIVCKISPDKFRDIDAVVRSYQVVLLPPSCSHRISHYLSLPNTPLRLP